MNSTNNTAQSTVELHSEPAKNWLLHHLLNTAEKPSINDEYIQSQVRAISGDASLELPVLVDELYREGLVSLMALEFMYLHTITHGTLMRRIEEARLSLDADKDIDEGDTPVYVKDLPESVLLAAAKNLVQFYEFTFFGERNVTEGTGLTFALEMQACQLGLVGDWIYGFCDDYDPATMMQNLVNALDQVAKKFNLNGWEQVSQHIKELTSQQEEQE